ncbi:MAG: hypothetical protein ACTS73_09570 [Arsenophonus sp. NEOnobi-MAG3]
MKYYFEPGLGAVDDESGAYHINIHGFPNYPRHFLETYGFYERSAPYIATAVKNKIG